MPLCPSGPSETWRTDSNIVVSSLSFFLPLKSFDSALLPNATAPGKQKCWHFFCCLVNPAPWRPPQKTCSSFIPSLPDESYANANASVLDVSLFKLSRYLNISYCICIALYTSVVPANIKSADGDVTPCQLKFSFCLIYRVLIQIAPARLSLSLSLSLAAYRLIRFLFDKSIGILPLVYTRPCAFAAVLTLSGAIVVWSRGALLLLYESAMWNR